MARYTIYRHPQRGDVAVSEGGLFSGGRAERLLRAGFRDAGLVDAGSASEALMKARGNLDVPARAPPRSVHTASRTPTASPAPSQPPRRAAPAPAASRAPANGPPVAALFRVGAGFAAFAIGLSVILGVLRNGSAPQAPPAGEYSDWMDYAEIEQYMQRVDTQNYWVVAVEGRWRGGEPECRILMDTAPQSVRHHWYWWCGRPREEFAEIDRDYRLQGYERVSLHSFADGDGLIRHSGAWHRVWPRE